MNWSRILEALGRALEPVSVLFVAGKNLLWFTEAPAPRSLYPGRGDEACDLEVPEALAHADIDHDAPLTAQRQREEAIEEERRRRLEHKA